MARTAGRSGSWALLGGLAVVAALQPPGCTQATPDDPGSEVVRALLADVGPQVVVPAVERFVARAIALEQALDDLDAAVQAGEGVDASREHARDAWFDAMAAWQESEVHQVGPAAPSSEIGGRDLRDRIYSWPTVNPCRLDQETVAAEWGDPGYFDGALVNVQGLDALEHLLNAPPSNACPGQVDINASGSWDALGESGVDAQRAEYAAAIGARVVHDAEALLSAWTAGDFSAELASAGDEGSPYPSQQDALNAVFGALFYLETETKDRKLAIPLGLQGCSSPTCPDAVEGRVSGGSTAWIAANLVGFRELFTGGEGVGLDDLLVELGHADLAASIVADVDAALIAADAVQVPIDEALASDRADLDALYDAVQRVTSQLKGDLATVLALQIPSEAAGDND